MLPNPDAKPFPIPVVSAPVGPGSQPDEDTLNYLTMPAGMSTFRAPRLPEPEDLAGHDGAIRVLNQAVEALRRLTRGERVEPVRLEGLGIQDLNLINQVLGEGEVAAQVLADPARPDLARVQIQESVFAGVWRVLETLPDGSVRDTIEVGAAPRALVEAARVDGLGTRPDLLSAPEGVINAQPIVTELEDARQGWRAGQPAHVVNLTLLPLSPLEIGWMDHVLGTGRVLILSRGYGNCRITNCRVPHTWRVVYYNSQDTVILNSVEVTQLPEVACAAPEDLADSLERMVEVMAWVEQG